MDKTWRALVLEAVLGVIPIPLWILCLGFWGIKMQSHDMTYTDSCGGCEGCFMSYSYHTAAGTSGTEYKGL